VISSLLAAYDTAHAHSLFQKIEKKLRAGPGEVRAARAAKKLMHRI
jgi:ATP-dependent protease HslVU (ClpYQ) peptidase subunit